ncbi:histone H3-like centromeric protein A [Ixodes scapularis]
MSDHTQILTKAQGKGSFAEVVRRGPAPRSESRATQVSPEILAAGFRAPAPRQGQQLLPPIPGGSTRAAPLSKDRPAAAAPAPSPRSPAGETERTSRSCSLERAPLRKEQHGAHAAPVKGGDRTSSDDSSPSSGQTHAGKTSAKPGAPSSRTIIGGGTPSSRATGTGAFGIKGTRQEAKVYLSQEGANQRGCHSSSAQGNVRPKLRAPPWLKNIRHLQRTTRLLIPRLSFARVVREILQGLAPSRSDRYYMQGLALQALQDASEDFVTNFLSASYLCSLYAKRKTLMRPNMIFLQNLLKAFGASIATAF